MSMLDGDVPWEVVDFHNAPPLIFFGGVPTTVLSLEPDRGTDHLRLLACLEVAFTSCGIGAARTTEPRRMTMDQVSLDHDGMLRYNLSTIKRGSVNARQQRVHSHFQCKWLTRRIMLVHVAIQLIYHANGEKRRQFFPEGVDFTKALAFVYGFLFGPSEACRSDVRQAIISFLNVEFPALANPAHQGVVVSDERLSEKSGHTQATHRRRYNTFTSSDRELAHEVHSALGYSGHANIPVVGTEGGSCAGVGGGSSYNLAGAGESELAISWFHRLSHFW